MKEELELNEIFEVEPAIIYDAWLDSAKHSAMTGGAAQCSTEEGGSFSSWDGYIEGKNIRLTSNKEIVQSWRTGEFGEDDEDSILTITLTAVEEGTKVTLKHTHIPKGQTQYKKGWLEHYFTPMKKYFSENK